MSLTSQTDRARDQSAPSVSTNPLLFIVGCGRSGTTLVRRLLSAHPQVAIPPETHWIPRLFRMADGRVTPEVVDHLLADRRFPKMKIGRGQLEALLDDEPSYAGFVSGIYDLYAQRKRKPFAGDKSPVYVREIPLLHELFPTARFVHLVRDGRDVALSRINWQRKQADFERRYATWREDPVSTAACYWRRAVGFGIAARELLPPAQLHEMRYEALVADPQRECERLCAFLGIPYDPAMLRFHEGNEQSDPGLDAKSAWRPVTKGLRDWRTEMSADQVERFEAVAGDLLVEFGYPVITSPDATAQDRADRAKESFARDVGYELPARW